MTVAALRVETLDSAQPLDAIEGEWRDLWARDPDASIFQSPDWLLAWRRRLGADVALRTLAVRRDGALAGLAPLFLHDGEAGRQLTWLGNGVSDSLDILAAPGEAQAVAQAVAAHLAASAADWDTADLRDMPARSALLRVSRAGGSVEPEEPRPVLSLLPPEAPAERFDPKLRRDLRQCRRRAETMGEVCIRTADATTVEADVQALFDLHAARWRGRGEAGVLADPAVQAFHHDIAACALERGWLRLHVLTVGGEMAAVHYGFTAGGRAYFYLGGFDARFERTSPGALLIEHALAEAAGEGAVSADFLRGREAYKYRWGAQDQPQSRLRLAARPG